MDGEINENAEHRFLISGPTMEPMNFHVSPRWHTHRKEKAKKLLSVLEPSSLLPTEGEKRRKNKKMGKV